MKQIGVWLVIWSVVGMTSCEEKVPVGNETAKAEIKELPTIKATQNESLIGRWLLTEHYANPGGGGVNYQKVDREFIIEFRSDSTLAISGKGFVLSERQGHQFRKVDERNIQIFNPKDPTRVLLIRYRASEKELEMRYGFCIEGCGEKYIAIK